MSDLTGRRFGHLVVTRLALPERSLWECRCDCGNTYFATASVLLRDRVKDCGCLQHGNVGARATKHGLEGTPLYRSWNAMKKRCYCPKTDSYFRYGARGIAVCDEWHDFCRFATWAFTHGYREGLSIDRIDGTGDYKPSNCRWATPKEQAENRATTIFTAIHGISQTLSDWARQAGLNKTTVCRRYRAGIRGEALIKQGRVYVAS